MANLKFNQSQETREVELSLPNLTQKSSPCARRGAGSSKEIDVSPLDSKIRKGSPSKLLL